MGAFGLIRTALVYLEDGTVKSELESDEPVSGLVAQWLFLEVQRNQITD
jgi:hypothetical protein